jgi:translation initiation factor IF-1
VQSSLTTLQGGKNRRRGTKENDDQRRELTFKEDGQEYAQVVKMLGNGRLEALCFDGSKRLANVSSPEFPPSRMSRIEFMTGTPSTNQ